jgi:hypothetical protein
MKCSLLQIHQHNKADWHKQYGADMALGGHRSLFLATNGIDLYDSIMMAKMETMLDFDQYLPIKMNANQMSGDTANGRPALDKKDQKDSTVVGKGYE